MALLMWKQRIDKDIMEVRHRGMKNGFVNM